MFRVNNSYYLAIVQAKRRKVGIRNEPYLYNRPSILHEYLNQRSIRGAFLFTKQILDTSVLLIH